MRSILEMPLFLREAHRILYRAGDKPQRVPMHIAVDAAGNQLMLPPVDVVTVCRFWFDLKQGGLLDDGSVLVQSWPGFLHFRVGQTDGEITDDGQLSFWEFGIEAPSRANRYEAASRLGEPPVSQSASERSVPAKAGNASVHRNGPKGGAQRLLD